MPPQWKAYWRGVSSVAREMADYLDRVGARIRWPRARTYLLKELSGHLEDQRAALEAAGVPPEEAERRAVADMGDPEPVGDELNALHRPARSLAPAVFALAVSLAGAAVIPALTGGSPLRYWAGLLGGLAAMALLRLVDLGALARRMGKWTIPLAAALPFLLMALTYAAPRLSTGAAPTWLLYPSLFLPLLFALVLLPLRGTHGGWLCALTPLMFLLAAPAGLVPSFTTALFLGGTMLLTASAAVMAGWFRGKPWVGLVSLWAPTALCTAWAVQFLLFSYRMRSFFHPELDPNGHGWQTLLIRNLLWEGSAEAAEVYNASFLYQDPGYTLLTLSAQLGRPVMLAALAGILLFAGLCLWRIRKLRSTTGKLLALSLFLPLFFQAGACWLQNAALFPFGSALPLPFFSYGPTSMVVDFALLGLLLSVFRMDPLQRDGPSLPLPQLFPRLLESLLCPEDEEEEPF